MSEPEPAETPPEAGGQTLDTLFHLAKSLTTMATAREEGQALQRQLTDGIIESVLLEAAKHKITTNADGVRKQIGETLAAIDTLAQRSQSARQQGSVAITDLLDSAGTLGAFESAALRKAPPRRDLGSEQIIMLQIADTLINLVRSEVKDCIERNISSVETKIDEINRTVHGLTAAVELNPAPGPQEQKADGAEE